MGVPQFHPIPFRSFFKLPLRQESSTGSFLLLSGLMSMVNSQIEQFNDRFHSEDENRQHLADPQDG